MMKSRRMLSRIARMVSLFAALAAPAAAQTTVRVAVDATTIWTPDFETKAAVVPVGEILTVVGRQSDWYEVLVPGSERFGGGTRGFVYKANVEAQTRSAAWSPRRRALGVVGIGQFAYSRFAAEKSFQAVLGQTGGRFLGGGAEVRFGAAFLNASVEHFAKTGQRVVVVDGEVYKLGISHTIAMTPVAVAAGWRFVHERATPYIGAGVGRILLNERSDVTEASENVNARYASYHVLGGIEFRNDWVASAFEVQYSRAPNTIGVGGASAAFRESNLGGLVGCIKVLVGR